jgi:hypothetical protein
MIVFRCECGRELQARDEDAGRRSKCPACGLISVIPPPEAILIEPSAGARVDRIRPDAVRKDEPERDRDRPRKRTSGRERYRNDDDDQWSENGEPGKNCTKAMVSVVLGLMSFPCVGNILTGLPAIIFGALALGEIGRSRGRLGGKGMAITGIVTGGLGIFVMIPAILLALLIPAVQKVREAAIRAQDQNNLKRMALAMHNFHDANGALPRAAAFRSPDGKPQLSWRVALLPYLGEQTLYQQFKLDEPWDGPNNSRLVPMIPQVYLQPRQVNDGSGTTHYQVFVGPGSVFDDSGLPKKSQQTRVPERGIRFTDITDGTSNTILIAEGTTAVPWSKPDDLPFNPIGPLPSLGGQIGQRFNIAFADGSIRTIDRSVPETTLKAMITRNGGEIFSMP